MRRTCASRGRQIVGRMPNIALGPADELGSGRLLPRIGVTPYAATLGKWMGLSDTETALVLPNASLFNTGGLGLF